MKTKITATVESRPHRNMLTGAVSTEYGCKVLCSYLYEDGRVADMQDLSPLVGPGSWGHGDAAECEAYAASVRS